MYGFFLWYSHSLFPHFAQLMQNFKKNPEEVWANNLDWRVYPYRNQTAENLTVDSVRISTYLSPTTHHKQI